MGLLLVAVGSRLVCKAVGCLISSKVGVARYPVEGERLSSCRQRVQESPDALCDGRLLVVGASTEQLWSRPGVRAE